MSFSGEVKKELSKNVPLPKHCRIAEITGYVLFTQKKIIDKNDMSAVQSLIDSFGDDIDTMKLCSLVNINGMIYPENKAFLSKSCCKRSFVRGAFLGCGSMSDPAENYHLEFSSQYREIIDLLAETLDFFGVSGKIAIRGNRFGLYFKDADKISDLLNITEAHNSLMSFENKRILKDVRNNVNRRVNCETSNLKKTACAASNAIKSINYLKERDMLDGLPENLRLTAEMRLKFPEKSLSELGEMLEPRVGKSGVSHRLDKLILMANDLKEKEAKV